MKEDILFLESGDTYCLKPEDVGLLQTEEKEVQDAPFVLVLVKGKTVSFQG